MKRYYRKKDLVFLVFILMLSQFAVFPHVGYAAASSVQSLAGGNYHSLALKSDGTLWAWGDNDYGQLGDGTTTRRYTPVQVLSGVQAIAAGARHSLALKSDGTLWAWGDNSVGDLGDGTTIDRHTPVQVLSGVQAVASRGFHSLALKSDGTLWAWGDNAYGQLGDGTTINSSTPVQVLSDVQAIAAGFNHSLAVKSNGTLWAWGDNDWGQLGDGTMTRRYTPVQVLSGVQAVAGGGAHSLALKSDDTLWAWGYNGDGELGDGTTTNSITPVQAQGLSGVQDIAAGYLFSLTLKSDGTLLAWGDNSSGQLGDGTAADSSTPVQVLSGVQAAAAGIVHGLALKSDGTLWAWGYNGSGQLGDGTVGTDRYSPVQVVFPQTDAEAVAADKATMAIGYAAGDSASGVTQNVTLPTGGASGTTISWTSDNTAITVSGSNGAVTRPGYSAGDATVTLTATISKGAATDTRIYVLTVIAQEETASSNADLSGLTLSNGTLSPVFAAGTLNYTASVANNVSAVTVTATVYDVVNATVTASVYNGAGMLMSGPISLTTGAPSGSLPLNEGNNTIKVVVTAEDGTTQTYLVIVSRNSDTSSPGPTSTGGISDSSTEFLVIINGKEHGQIVEEAVTQEGRQNVLTLTVDASRLADLLAKEVDKSVVIIPAALSENAEKVTVELTGDAVKAMENKQADLEVQTANGNYKLPAAQVFIDQIASQLGGQAKLSDIVIHVSIAKSDAEKVKLVESTAEKDKFTVVLPPVDFTVSASYNGQTVEVDKFSSYVEREIPLPDGIDPSKVTTAAVLAADGTLHHVPTYVTLRDGKYYAVVNSLTNSTYTLIWHPMTFEDVSGHWAKNAVNDMASRMVVKGVDATHYNPDAAITRAEFAAIIMRAAGLAEGQQTLMFRDVNAGDWYASAVAIAQEYGIIAGYGDGTFRPNQTISREEAMAMIARAMKLAGLSANVSDAESESILASFTDKAEVDAWAKQAVAATVKYGLVTGSETGLQPSRNITRAETAVVVQRMLIKAKLIDSKIS